MISYYTMKFNAAINKTPHIYSPTVFNMVNVPRIIVKTAIRKGNFLIKHDQDEDPH